MWTITFLIETPRRNPCRNLDGNVVGAIQFYNLHTYEMILVESDALRPDQQSGRRYTLASFRSSARASCVSCHALIGQEQYLRLNLSWTVGSDWLAISR